MIYRTYYELVDAINSEGISQKLVNLIHVYNLAMDELCPPGVIGVGKFTFAEWVLERYQTIPEVTSFIDLQLRLREIIHQTSLIIGSRAEEARQKLDQLQSRVEVIAFEYRMDLLSASRADKRRRQAVPVFDFFPRQPKTQLTIDWLFVILGLVGLAASLALIYNL